METRAKYALVGGVVLALIAIFVGFIFWVSSARNDADMSFYKIYFKKFSLAGMQENSWITMRGIKVGSVEYLRISPKDIELVEVLIKVHATTLVKKDTVAIIDRNLLTGFASIDLAGGSQTASSLLDTPGEEYPIIPEGTTSLASIQEGLPQLFEKTNQSMNRINNILTEENEKSITEMLKNLSVFSKALVERRDDISSAIKNINGVAEDTRSLLQNLDTRTKELTAAVSSGSAVISLEASRATQALESATSALSSTIESYENPKVLIGGAPDSAFGPGERPSQLRR